MSILDDLTDSERITTLNYPGIERYKSTILDIVAFSEQVYSALGNYNNGTLPYVDVLISELVDYQQKIRSLLVSLTSMASVPFPLVINLRDILREFGLLASYPDSFRENYKSLGVE